MKLFFWDSPYPVRWGCSVAYAVAETEDEARKLILAQKDSVYEYGCYKTKRPNFKVLKGPPTRVLDVPCADIIEWSE